MTESLTAIRRAGADLIISYYTPQVLQWIDQEEKDRRHLKNTWAAEQIYCCYFHSKIIMLLVPLSFKLFINKVACRSASYQTYVFFIDCEIFNHLKTIGKYFHDCCVLTKALNLEATIAWFLTFYRIISRKSFFWALSRWLTLSLIFKFTLDETR